MELFKKKEKPRMDAHNIETFGMDAFLEANDLPSAKDVVSPFDNPKPEKSLDSGNGPSL